MVTKNRQVAITLYSTGYDFTAELGCMKAYTSFVAEGNQVQPYNNAIGLSNLPVFTTMSMCEAMTNVLVPTRRHRTLLMASTLVCRPMFA